MTIGLYDLDAQDVKVLKKALKQRKGDLQEGGSIAVSDLEDEIAEARMKRDLLGQFNDDLDDDGGLEEDDDLDEDDDLRARASQETDRQQEEPPTGYLPSQVDPQTQEAAAPGTISLQTELDYEDVLAAMLALAKSAVSLLESGGTVTVGDIYAAVLTRNNQFVGR